MNPLHIAVRAGLSGLGGLGELPTFGVQPYGFTGKDGTGIYGGGAGGGIFGGGSGSGHSTRDFIGNIFNTSAGLVRDLFGNRNNNNTQTTTAGGLTPDMVARIQADAIARARSDESASAAISAKGIRIGQDSYISWPLIIGGLGAFYLIQSPGFQRRGR